MIDSDTQVQRGFVQHRRSRISGVNGEGQPLPSQVLEGEIAINLITRKLYTKRQMFDTYQYAQTVSAFDNTAGYKITISDLDFDSDATTISYSINGNSKSLVLDSDSLISDVITQIKNAAIAEVGAAQVTTDASSVTFFKTSGSSASVTFSTDFVKYIDFHYQPVVRVELNTAISLSSSSASTIIDFDLAPIGFRRTFGNGRLISHSGSFLYLIDFSGSLAVGYKPTQRNPRDEYQIIELNNVPTIKPTAPEKALNAGNFWIRNRDSESGKLYWLDTSITDDSDLQLEINNMDSDLRVAANAVVVDSDGQGNLLWGEWRAIVSTSLLGSSGGNSFEGDVTFNNNVIIDSDLTVNGDFIFDDKRFNDTSMFTVKNVTGNIIIAGHLFQVDSDLPEPGLPAS
tara:strand:+ start:2939 stop:4138 length:1200 start_codon:yes stop_codon:yes gene_type:complete